MHNLALIGSSQTLSSMKHRLPGNFCCQFVHIYKLIWGWNPSKVMGQWHLRKNCYCRFWKSKEHCPIIVQIVLKSFQWKHSAHYLTWRVYICDGVHGNSTLTELQIRYFGLLFNHFVLYSYDLSQFEYIYKVQRYPCHHLFMKICQSSLLLRDQRGICESVTELPENWAKF